MKENQRINKTETKQTNNDMEKSGNTNYDTLRYKEVEQAPRRWT